VNPNVDGCIVKPSSTGKYSENRKKQPLTEREPITQNVGKWWPDFLILTCQGWRFAPLPPQSVTLLVNPVCSPFKARTFSARMLFDETFARSDVFAVLNCPVVVLSVFYSIILRRSLIFLQLWTALT